MALRPETAAQALARITPRLRAAGVPDPERDARRLMAHALDLAPDRLTLGLGDALSEVAAARLEDAVTARAARRPVSQIVGRRAFYGHAFLVTRDVLDPRPETETLVEVALELPFRSVLDLGTGSGAILLSLLAACPAGRGVGGDISAPALEVAAVNARALGLSDRAELVRGDWFAPVAGRFDLIVSNPPYIAASEMAALEPEVREYEPRVALCDEGDGLAAYRAIAAGARDHLTAGGALVVEVGAGQAAAVAAMMEQAGLREAHVRHDLDGRPRVVSARRD